MSHSVGRISALLEVLTVALLSSFLVQAGFSFYGFSSGIILADSQLVFLFQVSEALITLLLVALFLGARGESFRNIGWRWERFSIEIGIGILSLPMLFGATAAVAVLFHWLLPGYVSATNPLLDLVQERVDLLLFLVSSIFVGGFKEEIQRAFVLIRFENHLGGIFLGLVLWSVFFGFLHKIQGVDKAVGAGILGLLFGLLYVWRRKLAAPMVSHALYDVVTVIVFWGRILNPKP